LSCSAATCAAPPPPTLKAICCHFEALRSRIACFFLPHCFLPPSPPPPRRQFVLRCLFHRWRLYRSPLCTRVPRARLRRPQVPKRPTPRYVWKNLRTRRSVQCQIAYAHMTQSSVPERLCAHDAAFSARALGVFLDAWVPSALDDEALHMTRRATALAVDEDRLPLWHLCENGLRY